MWRTLAGAGSLALRDELILIVLYQLRGKRSILWANDRLYVSDQRRNGKGSIHVGDSAEFSGGTLTG
jgi:hypothetical protein